MAIYTVSWSGAMRTRFRELYRRARLQGRSAEFLAAGKTIQEQLESNPTSFGEVSFQYHHLKLLNHAGAVYPLAVEFCIDEERKIVYVRRLRLLRERCE